MFSWSSLSNSIRNIRSVVSNCITSINRFVAKLTGSNKGKRRYAEATNYAKVLTGVYNGIPKGENGILSAAYSSIEL